MIAATLRKIDGNVAYRYCKMFSNTLALYLSKKCTIRKIKLKNKEEQMKKLTTMVCLIVLAVAGYQAMAAEDENTNEQLWKFNTKGKVAGALLETAQNQITGMTPSYDPNLAGLADEIFKDKNVLRAFNVDRRANSTIINDNIIGSEGSVVSVEWITKYSMAGCNNKWICEYRNNVWTITPPKPFLPPKPQE